MRRPSAASVLDILTQPPPIAPRSHPWLRTQLTPFPPHLLLYRAILRIAPLAKVVEGDTPRPSRGATFFFEDLEAAPLDSRRSQFQPAPGVMTTDKRMSMGPVDSLGTGGASHLYSNQAATLPGGFDRRCAGAGAPYLPCRTDHQRSIPLDEYPPTHSLFSPRSRSLVPTSAGSRPG